MTRNAWVTVRLPGASTAPATSTRTWRHTGAVKHGRNTDSHTARTVGTRGGTGAATAPGRFACIAVLESNATRAARLSPARHRRPSGFSLPHRGDRHSA